MHKKRLVIDGRSRRVNVCTRCLRTQLKRMAAGKPAIPEGALSRAR